MQRIDTATTVRGRPSSLYVLSWAALACAAIVYLAVAAARPELIPGPGVSGAQPESNEGQRALSDALAEVNALKDSLAQVQTDVAGLRTELAGPIATRLAALEEKPRKGGSATAQSPAPQTAESKSAAAAAQFPASGVTTGAPASKAGAVKVLNTPAPDAAPVVTGSVANAASATAAAPASASPAAPAAAKASPSVSFGPAVVKAEPRPVGVQLATGPSVDSLRLSWSLLADRHADALRNLSPRYVAGSNAFGETFDLVAGPLKSAADAQRLCKSLEARAVPCKVGDYTGEGL